MYADKEEALRRTLASGPMTPEEREKQLQEELRRRAADSRRDTHHQSHDMRRASRRRGEEVEDRYMSQAPRDSGDGRWREEASYRHQRSGGRRPHHGDDARMRRRSRSPVGRGSRAVPFGAEYETKSVFCSELDSRVGQRDLGEFFEDNLGPHSIVDVRLEVEVKTGASRGIGYVELSDAALVPRALELSGKRMFGWPILVQNADAARKNPVVGMYEPPRASVSTTSVPPPAAVPSNTDARLYVGNLHFDIAAPHVRAVFEPFGPLDDVEVYYHPVTGKSKGFAFVQFQEVQDAQQAMEQLNGMDLAGRAMRVGPVNARGSDRRDVGPSHEAAPTAVLLRHMFDPREETEPQWHVDLSEDVRLECTRHGHVDSVFVDKDSHDGEVYVCFHRPEEAQSACASLQGRFFGGKLVEARLISASLAQAKYAST